MVAVFILGVASMAGMGSFRYIARAVQQAKVITIANRLAEEKMVQMKEFSYFQLLVSTSTTIDTRVTPNITYDNAIYKLAKIQDSNISFERAVQVDFAFRYGNSVSTAAWTTQDTGLKLIKVYVIWRDRGRWRQQTLESVVSNPVFNPMNASFRGVVRSTAGVGLVGARVQVLENASWFAYTTTGGNYSFNVSPGTYSLQCSMLGYFPQTTTGYIQINNAQTLVQNFTLAKMSTGTASGYIYGFNNLVISQVVASTGSAGEYEYIELYNPTTKSIAMNNAIDLYYYDDTNTPTLVQTVAVSSYVPAFGYYLLANTPTLPTGTGPMTVDAYFLDPLYQSPNHLLPTNRGAGLRLQKYGTGIVYDAVAWHGATLAPLTPREGTPITPTVASGLSMGEQLIRMTDPGFVRPGIGSAYDSGHNSLNFRAHIPTIQNPRNHLVVEPAIAGVPAVNAQIRLDDPLSPVTRAISTTVAGGYPAAYFTVPNIASGTWTGWAYLNQWGRGNLAQIDNIVVPPFSSTGIPNGSTIPSWTVPGLSHVMLDETTNYALIAGTIYDGFGNPLPNIRVYYLGKSTLTGLDGSYFLSVPPGSGTLYANWNYANAAYTLGIVNLTVLSGQLYDPVDVNIYLGGTLRGYFQTPSGSPLAGRAAVALFGGGNQYSQAVSDAYGYFYLNNITTGSYTITPALDPAEVALPSSQAGVLLSTGSATFTSTFTIVNALGKVTGQVLYNTQPITTGVLVLATTGTVSGNPPPLQGSSGPECNPCYYSDLSDGSAHYSLSVRSNPAPYNVYAWYPRSVNGVVTMFTGGPTSVAVSTGQVVNVNFSW